MLLFLKSLEHALIFLPFSMAMFLAFKVLKITDLTFDGSYVLGAVVFALCLQSGINPYAAMFISIIASGCCGIIVALCHHFIGGSTLLIGILAAYVLYSVNSKILGQPSLSLLSQASILPKNQELKSLILIGTGLLFTLSFCLKSKLGLLFKAFGDNQPLLAKLGYSPLIVRTIGLFLANSLVGLSGVLMAETTGFVDVHMGIGMALIALTTVVLADQLIKKSKKLFKKANIDIYFVLSSCFVYFFVLNCLQYLGVNPLNLNIVVGIILLSVLKFSNQGKLTLRDSHA